MKITDDIKQELGIIGLNVFNYDVSDICDDEGADEWVQVDNGLKLNFLRVLYQGPGGERFDAWKRGFFAGWDYAATERGKINRK